MLNFFVKFLKGLEIVCYILLALAASGYLFGFKNPDFISVSVEIKLPLPLILALTGLGNVYLLNGIFKPMSIKKRHTSLYQTSMMLRITSSMLWFGSGFSIIGTLLWGLGFSKSDYSTIIVIGVLVIAISCLILAYLYQNKSYPNSLNSLLARAIPSLLFASFILCFK